MLFIFAALSASFVLLSPFAARAAAAVKFETLARPEGSYEAAFVDPEKAKIELRWKDAAGRPFQTLAAARDAVKSEGRAFELATNAGMYSKSSEPLGLHVENGRTLAKANRSHASTGNFFLVPNGVFFVKGARVGVQETSAFLASKTAPDFATQSGPMLVIDGRLHPRFKQGSTNAKYRSGVGVDAKGRAVFAISRGPVSFYDFAAFFRDQLRCSNALYLDGTISSLLKRSEASTQAMPFVGILAVSRSAP